MLSTSHIEIEREAINSNISFIRSLCSEETVISAVVKGNAYGHGINKIIPILEDLGIHHFSVYSSPEAREASKYTTPDSSIMIMGFIAPEDMDWVINKGIEFFVSDPDTLDIALSLAGASASRAKIHLEVETGMNRTGLSMLHLKEAVKAIQEHKEQVEVRGIASHLAGAESIANYKRIKNQLAIFHRRVQYLEKNGISGFKRHIASSAGLINYPESRFDMVRTGILIYGFWPTRETQISYLLRKKERLDPLKRAIGWQTTVMQVKHVPEGEFIGYGLNYQADRNMKTMVLPVGYCNGYSRSLSNNGHVIVHGQRSPVIGMVNMNMIICDITEIDDVKNGDPVTLIGHQDDVEITFSSFADMNNTLNYEILARLPGNLERIVK
jgi:alanine racemase